MRKEIGAEKLKGLSSTTVYQLKIELRDIEPLVWRRLIVTNDLSLWKLHEILQVVMGR